MAKFIKSIFHTDKKKYEEEEVEERSESPAVGTRRQLSISRSGRMRQAHKKRHSLALELYGDDIQFETPEKPTVREYHVNHPVRPTHKDDWTKDSGFEIQKPKELTAADVRDMKIKTPEEEIDNAFENIDKS